MGKAQRKARGLQAVFGLVVVLAVFAIHATTGWLDGVDRRLYDASVLTSGRVASPNVAIIAIDEASLVELGAWPWPLELHAQLVERLTQAGARAVVFTPTLSLPSNEAAKLSLRRLGESVGSDADPAVATALSELRLALDGQASLARSLATHGKVVLAADAFQSVADRDAANIPAWAVRSLLPAGASRLRTAGRVQWPGDELGLAAAAVGHRVLQPDVDLTLRSHAALLAVGKQALPSLALAAAGVVGSGLSRGDGGAVRQGKQPLVTGELETLRPLFYTGRAGVKPFLSASYLSVLRGQVPQQHFTRKLVLIGHTAPALDAGVATPLGRAMPAVEVFAHMTSSVLNRELMRVPLWALWAQGLAMLTVAAMVAGVLPRLRPWHGLVVCGGFAALLLAVEWALLTQSLLWVALGTPVVSLMLGLMAVLGWRLAHGSQRQAPATRPIAQQLALGDALLAQLQLDLAWAHLRKLPLARGPEGEALMDSLYRLGCAFEQRGEAGNAQPVFLHMATHDAAYKDLAVRLGRLYKTKAPRAEATPAAPGLTMLGRYRVERELGRGAMGAVLLGIDPTIGRQVALKTLALGEEFDGEALTEARQRFFREAETAGRLQHHDIVTIFDAGEDGGLAYIAMEFLTGHDLSRYTQLGQLLPVASVLSVVARVAEALAYAHRQGVVHRDIKPANVMLDPATNSVKVTDFGIARITDSSRTRTGVILGTPSYMSPEQMAGRRVDGRSDLYSLGVMLFQLLCGQLPHKADSMAALMHQIANQPAADVRKLRPELSEALANVVTLALQKRPEMRYADGHELAEDLQAVAGQLSAAERAGEPPQPQAVATAQAEAGLFAATVRVPSMDSRHNPTE